jgi:hypothetical protein
LTSAYTGTAHSGEVDLAFRARFPVDHRHRPTAATPLILGVFLAVTVQRPLRDDHALAGQQVADLDHRQALVDPPVDLTMVGAQHFPHLAIPVGAIWAHHGDHRTDQSVVELINTTGPVQASSHGGLDIATRGFPIHPALGGHHPQSVAGQPRPKYFTNLDHRNLPKHPRTPSHVSM